MNPRTNVISLLEKYKSMPERNPRAAAAGRSNFLREASEMRAGVSAKQNRRLFGWKIKSQKEKFAMNMFISIIVTLALLAGGGATAYAAQDDLPNQPLYGIKTFTEEVGLAFTNEPTARLERLLLLAQHRVDEMAGLAAQGVYVPAPVAEQLHQHIENALQLAAGQNDEEMQASLLRIREQLQVQEQILNQIQTRAGETTDPNLEQARLMIRERIQMTEDGLEDPEQFRYNYQHRNPEEKADLPTPTSSPEITETPQPNPTAGGYSPGPMGTPNLNKNSSTLTPMPGSDNPGGGSGGNNEGGDSGGGTGGKP